MATLGLPDSPGVPKAATATTLVAPYNDLESVREIFRQNKGEIAAVVLEPVVGNSGESALAEPQHNLSHGQNSMNHVDRTDSSKQSSYQYLTRRFLGCLIRAKIQEGADKGLASVGGQKDPARDNLMGASSRDYSGCACEQLITECPIAASLC